MIVAPKIIIIKIITTNNNNYYYNNSNGKHIVNMSNLIRSSSRSVNIVFLIVHSAEKMLFNSVFERIDVFWRFIPNTRCHI